MRHISLAITVSACVACSAYSPSEGLEPAIEKDQTAALMQGDPANSPGDGTGTPTSGMNCSLCGATMACGTACRNDSGALTTCGRSDASSCCVAGANQGDLDCDGVPDSLEAALARRFFPNMNMHVGTYEGHPDGSLGQYYGSAVGTVGGRGQLPFLVRPVKGLSGGWCSEDYQCLELVIGNYFNWDLGDDNPVYPNAHRGDSELVAVLVARQDPGGASWGTDWAVARTGAQYWRRVMDFYAAHMCDTGDASQFVNQGRQGLAVRGNVWVAEGKNGSYPSQSSCNSGGTLRADDCSDNRGWIDRDAAVARLKNVGEPADHKNFDTTLPIPGRCMDCSPLIERFDVWRPQSGFVNHYPSSLKRGTLGWTSGKVYCL